MTFNTLFRTAPARAMLVAVATGALVLLTHFVFSATTDYQNGIRVREIAQQTLKRAERSADYALVAINELISAGDDNCDARALEQIRRSIYLHGVLKDVRVVNGQGETLCAGLSQSDVSPMSRYEPKNGLSSADSNIHFHLMGARNMGLIGVSWSVSPDRTMLAVLNVDSLMFDVFPQSLRDRATAGLFIGDEQFAYYYPVGKSLADQDTWQKFLVSSDRFPLSAELTVSPAAFSQWNREAEPYALFLAGVIGALLGYLIALAASRDRDMSIELKRALRRGEFIGHVQPIFELSDKKIIAGEILARWQKADGTMIPPIEFIGLAEDNGLIVPITWQIMENTLVQMNGFLASHPEMRIGFNIAPSHLMSEGFAGDMLAIMSRFDVNPHQIIIEITERQQFDNIGNASDIIQKLRGFGFMISLDDTGTGHNGLSYVQKLGIDIIKVDKHFVDYVGIDRVATKIIEMLVQLAVELNMTIVAEGIETEAQLEALRALKVDKDQGYLVSRPLTPAAFIEFATAERPKSIDQRAA